MNITAFKNRVINEWQGDETAAAWQKHFPMMRTQLAAVTQALVDAAEVKPGMAILDLASGVGEPSLSLAKAAGPNGSVTATDFSSAMLSALRHNAEAEGLTNLKTETADAHELPFGDAAFDRVTSRFGVMFFGEVDRALAEVRRVLKPGGKMAFLVWGAPAPGTYFGTAVVPFVKRMEEKPDPDGPGPMRFAEPGKLTALVAAAGFTDVTETIHSFPAPYHGSPEQMLADLMEIAAPFRTAAATLSADQYKEAEREVLDGLAGFENNGVINVTAPVLIVSGTKRD